MRNSLKEVRKLHQKKFRVLNNRFIIEGIKNNEILFKKRSDWINSVYYCPEVLEKSIINYIKSLEFHTEQITKDELEYISTTKTPQGVISTASLPENYFISDLRGFSNNIIFFDRIREPGNLGTFLRTLAWFGFFDIVLNNCVELFSPKVIRSSAGAIFNDFKFHIYSGELREIIEELKIHKFKIISSTSQTGENLYEFSFPEKSVIIFGNEPSGVSEDLLNYSDYLLKIPGHESIESLNVGVAGGIILSLLYKQRKV